MAKCFRLPNIWGHGNALAKSSKGYELAQCKLTILDIHNVNITASS